MPNKQTDAKMSSETRATITSPEFAKHMNPSQISITEDVPLVPQLCLDLYSHVLRQNRHPIRFAPSNLSFGQDCDWLKLGRVLHESRCSRTRYLLMTNPAERTLDYSSVDIQLISKRGK